MNEQWTWQPVGNPTDIRCDCGECDRSIGVDDGEVTIYDDADGEEMTAHLPDDYALCRRVPAPAAGVPVEYLDVVHAALVDYEYALRAYYDDNEAAIEMAGKAAAALAWLDSQRPQAGQESVREGWCDACGDTVMVNEICDSCGAPAADERTGKEGDR